MGVSVPVDIATGGGAAAGASSKGQGQGQTAEPVFEMVVLGSGGGPLETDCSGWVLTVLILHRAHRTTPFLCLTTQLPGQAFSEQMGGWDIGVGRWIRTGSAVKLAGVPRCR